MSNRKRTLLLIPSILITWKTISKQQKDSSRFATLAMYMYICKIFLNDNVNPFFTL